ncbi:hypothetical protein Back11_52190 [Paenibacillus baekrokdamisoli]|uniref:Uncharacterized protein n=1 Tax=Paenibacillus baekrokdamisoli TaxID=1712516 RepID=A0A3G9JLV0_9BACL|nr:stage II sporulation protein D [Paenibacillus baekrokdamisoli]MBB3069056.1 stage II sporulation protein D [Paenibacillus baekrokdamisoli]BBH23874.1 hypothetical protein Back11_52190 [Paenibacillus baekrokdamisoli]
MERMKWKTKRYRRFGRGTSRWWLGFTFGLLLAVLVKEFVHGSESHVDPNKQSTVEIIESASLQGKAAVSNNQSDRNTPSNRSSQTVTADSQSASLSDYDRMWVRVYLAEDKRIEKMPIELYVRGVVAGEMPIDFELEALKAQAIAARTYIYKRMLSADHSDLPSNEQEADVTDTVNNQVYVSMSTLLSRWSGKEKEENLKKLNEAVEQTRGQIITYEGEPIQAAFFSTSNGYTENASDYWSIDLPYLRSVASPWDKAISPRYKETVTMKLNAFSAKLGVKKNAIRSMRIVDTTEGKRIRTVVIGDESFSGREMREKLGLASSQFNWTIQDDEITITTYGFGHGVGMSQWGANGMAHSGQTAKQIVTYYYSGTKVQEAKGLVESLS